MISCVGSVSVWQQVTWIGGDGATWERGLLRHVSESAGHAAACSPHSSPELLPVCARISCRFSCGRKSLQTNRWFRSFALLWTWLWLVLVFAWIHHSFSTVVCRCLHFLLPQLRPQRGDWIDGLHYCGLSVYDFRRYTGGNPQLGDISVVPRDCVTCCRCSVCNLFPACGENGLLCTIVSFLLP